MFVGARSSRNKPIELRYIKKDRTFIKLGWAPEWDWIVVDRRFDVKSIDQQSEELDRRREILNSLKIEYDFSLGFIFSFKTKKDAALYMLLIS